MPSPCLGLRALKVWHMWHHMFSQGEFQRQHRQKTYRFISVTLVTSVSDRKRLLFYSKKYYTSGVEINATSNKAQSCLSFLLFHWHMSAWFPPIKTPASKISRFKGSVGAFQRWKDQRWLWFNSTNYFKYSHTSQFLGYWNCWSKMSLFSQLLSCCEFVSDYHTMYDTMYCVFHTG